MQLLLMASVTLLLGSAIIASGWRRLVPASEPAVPGDDTLPATDESYLSLCCSAGEAPA